MQFGEVVSTVILVEKGGTGLSRGCAFVSYTEMSAAHAAIAALDNQMMLPNAPYNLRVSRLRGLVYRVYSGCVVLALREVTLLRSQSLHHFRFCCTLMQFAECLLLHRAASSSGCFGAFL